MNPIVIYKEITALFAVKGEVSKMSVSELSTSEGRLAIIGSIVSIYSAVHSFIPATWAAAISAGLGAAYIVARGLVKFGEALAPLIPKIQPVVDEAGKDLDAIVPPVVK